MKTLLAGLLSCSLFSAGLPLPASGAALQGFPEVVARVQSGTVMIESRNHTSLYFGSGFFLDTPEVVVTAYHVVKGASRIRITIPNTFLTSDALLLAASPEWDIAVLRVSWPSELQFPGLSLARSEELLPAGSEVAYTGYGFGTDESFVKVLSTYRGIVSSLVPHLGGHLYHLSGLVNKGLSGCALYLPGNGEVVGVVTRHFGPDGLGMGFGGAVPSSVVSRLIEGIRR